MLMCKSPLTLMADSKGEGGEIELPSVLRRIADRGRNAQECGRHQLLQDGEVGQVLIARHQEAELPPVWRWRAWAARSPWAWS